MATSGPPPAWTALMTCWSNVDESGKLTILSVIHGYCV